LVAGNHVLAVSIALRKTKSFPVKLVAPELYRSVNLQEEWGKLFNVEAKTPEQIEVLADYISKLQ
jgi:hypothetical protein